VSQCIPCFGSSMETVLVSILSDPSTPCNTWLKIPRVLYHAFRMICFSCQYIDIHRRSVLGAESINYRGRNTLRVCSNWQVRSILYMNV